MQKIKIIYLQQTRVDCTYIGHEKKVDTSIQLSENSNSQKVVGIRRNVSKGIY